MGHEMKEKVKVNNIENIYVLDATLRDGGLVNDFYFTDSFAKAVYEANIAAGVDYMEFGYRADKAQFASDKFGKWKFSSDDDIRAIVGDNKTKMKLSIMVDVGRCNYKEDIRKKSDSPVDMVRVATYIDTIPEAIKMIEHADAQGYETTCNIMAISQCTENQLCEALKLLAKSPIKGAYIVDSYGALYPQQIRKVTKLFYEKLAPAGKLVGIHTHNNQQCAFANTLESLESGARMLDATAYGMGRGAGNCHMEALIGYLNGERYHVEPLLDLVTQEMLPLREQGNVWGYNTSYMLTGLANKHPRSAIEATKKNDTNYREQFNYVSYE